MLPTASQYQHVPTSLVNGFSKISWLLQVLTVPGYPKPREGYGQALELAAQTGSLAIGSLKDWFCTVAIASSESSPLFGQALERLEPDTAAVSVSRSHSKIGFCQQLLGFFSSQWLAADRCHLLVSRASHHPEKQPCCTHILLPTANPARLHYSSGSSF